MDVAILEALVSSEPSARKELADCEPEFKKAEKNYFRLLEQKEALVKRLDAIASAKGQLAAVEAQRLEREAKKVKPEKPSA